MKISPVYAASIIVVALLLGGCHTLDQYEWTGPQVLHGSGGIMKNDGGIEIWIQGEPSRDYVPIKIVETMCEGSIGVQSYLFGVLKKQTRALGGNGFIVLSKDTNGGGAFVTGSSTTSGTASLYGNTAYMHTATAGSAIAVPIQYNTYRALVFRYKDSGKQP